MLSTGTDLNTMFEAVGKVKAGEMTEVELCDWKTRLARPAVPAQECLRQIL